MTFTVSEPREAPSPGAPAGTPVAVAAPRASAPEALLGMLAALLPLAFSTALHGMFWSPKAALLLPVVVPGLVALTLAVRRRVPGARFAAAFVVAAGVSAALADRPLLSLLGSHNSGTGWLFVASLVGLWAIGAQLSLAGTRVVTRGLLVGVVASAAVAWIQATVALPDDIDTLYGRATGFLGNPVHLGALAAAGLALLAPRLVGAARWPWVAVPLVAGAVQLAGGRSGLLVAAAVTAVWAWRLRWLRGAALVAVVVAGIGVAGVMSSAADGARTATGRADELLTPGGDADRTEAWQASVEAIAARPVAGWGPGRLRTGVSPRVGSGVVASEGAEFEYTDAHNVVLEFGVTTGLAGLALFGGWLLVSGHRARGPLAGFALAGVAVGLAQPLSLGVTPLLALAFGAATARSPQAAVPRPRGRPSLTTAVGAVGAVAGLAAAGLLLAGELYFARAAIDFSERDLVRAERLLPPWPDTADLAWRIHAFQAISERDPSGWNRARDAAEEAVERDPARATAWNNLADLEMRVGDEDAARRAYEAAFERHPWSNRALTGLVYFADRDGDAERVEELCERKAVIARPGPGRSAGTAECVAEVRRTYAS